MTPKKLSNAAEIGSGDANRGAGPMANFTFCLGKGWQFVTEICYKGKQGLKHSTEPKKTIYIKSWKLARKTMGSDIPLIFLSTDNHRLPECNLCARPAILLLMCLWLCLILSDRENWFMAENNRQQRFALSWYENISHVGVAGKTLAQPCWY